MTKRHSSRDDVTRQAPVVVPPEPGQTRYTLVAKKPSPLFWSVSDIESRDDGSGTKTQL